MEPSTAKLTRKLGDERLAEKLVEGGLDTPGKLKRAKDKDIRDIPGVGQSSLERVRAVFPKA